MSKKAKSRKKATKKKARRVRPRCGLCGESGNLTKTDCCDEWICDDEANYRAFSYDRNSCYRNHRRLTLCGYHHAEEHSGDWQTCPQCRKGFEREVELYVYYGTNEYNFEKLKDPPTYEPTHCSTCGAVIVLSEGRYSCKGNEYSCGACTSAEFPDLG